jgi:hypothetical protein
MNISEELHLAYKIGNGQISNFPFPHLYIKDIFPWPLYEKIQENIPEPDKLVTISEKRPVKGYKERFVLCFDDQSLSNLDDRKRFFWTNFRNQMLSGSLKNFLISRFFPLISERFKNQNVEELEFYDELLLIQDTMNYKIGPHTDSPKKVLTFLFYLPKDNSQKDLGTSIYMPIDFNLKCAGTAHHPRENFHKIISAPYLPNSLLCFVKTDNSFHGVEKIVTDEKRWLLLYDIYIAN